jgi:hypothetical protein
MNQRLSSSAEWIWSIISIFSRKKWFLSCRKASVNTLNGFRNLNWLGKQLGITVDSRVVQFLVIIRENEPMWLSEKMDSSEGIQKLKLHTEFRNEAG